VIHDPRYSRLDRSSTLEADLIALWRREAEQAERRGPAHRQENIIRLKESLCPDCQRPVMAAHKDKRCPACVIAAYNARKREWRMRRSAAGLPS
jgi:hypothetical protein